MKLLLLKLAALLSFCGGPLITIELIEPHRPQWLAFGIVFLPFALMLWGALALDSSDYSSSERLGVRLGLVGSVATALMHLFGAWYLYAHPGTTDRPLKLVGIVVGLACTCAYIYFARRWLQIRSGLTPVGPSAPIEPPRW